MKKKWNFLRKIVLPQLNFSVGRTGFLLLLILFAAIQAKAWSQSRITVGMQGATIDEVIKEVRETSGYRFFVPGGGSEQVRKERYRCPGCGGQRFS